MSKKLALMLNFIYVYIYMDRLQEIDANNLQYTSFKINVLKDKLDLKDINFNLQSLKITKQINWI